MINLALMGAGRIGKMHAEIISAHPEANLQFVYDINQEFASQVANQNNAETVSSPEEAINNDKTTYSILSKILWELLNLSENSYKIKPQIIIGTNS